MRGWLHYLELQAKVKTGLSSSVIAWASVAAVGGAVTFGFLVLTAFIWLADRYTPLSAALILGAFFLLITIIALIASLVAHGRTVERARQELTVRSPAPWLDPRYLTVGLQVVRAIGARRLVPLVAVGLLAAGLAKEWAGGDRSAGEGGGGESSEASGDEREAA
jgi:hypothetical protein